MLWGIRRFAWFTSYTAGRLLFKENEKMIRKDTFEIEISVGNEEVKDGIFLNEDSIVVFEAYIDDSGPELPITNVTSAYAELAYENEDGVDVILNEEDTEQAEKKAFDMTEERAHELAWEARYDDRN
jgi:hypothetical protein